MISGENKEKIIIDVCGLEPSIHKAYDKHEIKEYEKWSKCSKQTKRTIKIIELYKAYDKDD